MIIDTSKVPNDISLDGLMILVKAVNESVNEAKDQILLYDLEDSKYIKIISCHDVTCKFDIRSKGYAIVENKEIFLEEYAPRPRINTDWIDTYRGLFKTVGTRYSSDKNSIIKRLEWFGKTYPEFNDQEIIIKAAEKYIAEEAFKNYQYLQRADYFICKGKGMELTSRLATYCEQIQDDPDDTNSSNTTMI
jgi:hypothetical protein